GNDSASASQDASPPLPDAPAWTEMELLNFEKEALGLFWTGHPVDSHSADLQEIGARTIGELQGTDETVEAVAPEDLASAAGRPMARSGEDVAVGGIISAVRPLKTRKGDPMAVATLEDRHGSLE